MTTTSPRLPKHRSRPFWDVTCVHDPDGGGADFAYSVGLHRRGFPELHLPARPTEGSDPGADWMFGHPEIGELVNEFAGLLLAGAVGSGSTLERSFDEGIARVVFHFGEPVAPHVVSALGAAPRATVIPVGWSLHRRPPAAYVGVDARGARQLSARIDLLADRLAHIAAPAMPSHWRVSLRPEDHEHGEQGPFGPCSTLVELRCREVWLLDAPRLARLLEFAATADAGFSSGHVLARADELARRSGRSGARLCAVQRAGELVDSVVGKTRRWREAVRALAGPGASGRERTHLGEHLVGVFRDLVAAQLTLDVVGDLADASTTAAAAGPMRWAEHEGPGSPPGYALVDAAALGLLRGLLLRWGPSSAARLGTLGEVVARHTCRLESVVLRLSAMALAEPAGVPSLDPVLEPCERRTVEVPLLLTPSAQRGLALVCALLYAPDRIAAELRVALLDECADELPGLEEAVALRLSSRWDDRRKALAWPFILDSHVPRASGRVCSHPDHGAGRHD